jgi:hypothetical protein
MSIALSRAQVASILKHFVIASEGSSRLTIAFSSFPFISLSNIFLAIISGSFGT